MTLRSKPMDAVDREGTRLLRTEEVAEHLNVSRSMAWKIISAGDLRSVRIGRAVRVRPRDLAAYLDDVARERR